MERKRLLYKVSIIMLGLVLAVSVLAFASCGKEKKTPTPTPLRVLTATPMPTLTPTPIPTPVTVGPDAFNIGTGSGYRSVYLSTEQRVEANFQVAGADVTYKVLDPGGNTILFKNEKGQSGSFAFRAVQDGTYKMQFNSAGIITPSVVTLTYTIYEK